MGSDIPELTAEEEAADNHHWRCVTIADQRHQIDMKVIEPYKKVLSHGGKSVHFKCHCRAANPDPN